MPTVIEDVAFSLRSKGLSKDEINSRALAVLHRFHISHLANEAAHSLSSGQKQLLAICAIVVAEPKLIVADEPTALLDIANSRQVANLLLHELEQQLVLVTHDLELAKQCDVLLRFAGGKLIDYGEPSSVIQNYLADFR